MSLTPGAHFGPYLVLAPLGSGGMGEVYRARDTRLQRDVALKILRGTGAEVPERVRRFQREAYAASSLNHPNIVVVYEAGEADPGDGQGSVPFLAMELVQGQPLNSVIGSRALPLRAVLDIAAQVADGLARAHESGIAHRDLKPGNLLVTPDGLVKIVDFGLAKLLAPQAPSGTSSADTASGPGTLLGTPGYMSPEQARGEEASFASDQFAFGCVAYEMLTGRRAFGRASRAEMTSAILRDEPTPIAELRSGLPAPLVWIVERCLSKDPKDRYASTRDLARDLRTLKERAAELGSPGPGGAAARATKGRGPVAALVAGLALALAAIALLWYGPMRPASEPEFRRLTFQEGSVFRALFVPRSDAVLYTASWEGRPARTFMALPDASGLDRPLESETQLPMAFSEDGSEVLVLLGTSRASLNLKGTLAVWPAGGGRPRRIVDDAGWADWAGGDRLVVFVRDLGAERALIRREGGSERTLFQTAGAISYVRLSPDRSEVAFIHHASRRDDSGEVRLMRLDASGGARTLTPVFETCLGLDWNRRTAEVWFTATRAPHGTSLLAVNRSGHLRTLHSLPEIAVLEAVATEGERCLLTLRDARIALAVRRGREPARDLTWLGLSLAADVSPDGRTVLFWDGGASERSSGTWLRPLDGSDAVRLGEGEPRRFSPDGGSLVAVTRPTSGATRFLLIPVGAGATRMLVPPDADSTSPSLAGPDALLFVRRIGGRKGIWKMQADGTGARSLGANGCDDPMASPSGESFLAICRDAASALEVHAMTTERGRTLFELPPDDAFTYARWNATGDRVFGVTRRRRFLTLEASTGALLSEGRLPSLGKGEADDLVSAGLSADGSVQAYSAQRSLSRLYVAEGIR